VPRYPQFPARPSPSLKDGQTGQSTSVTDPVSGQVIKLDAD
jgi:hypothetical protein